MTGQYTVYGIKLDNIIENTAYIKVKSEPKTPPRTYLPFQRWQIRLLIYYCKLGYFRACKKRGGGVLSRSPILKPSAWFQNSRFEIPLYNVCQFKFSHGGIFRVKFASMK